MLSISVISKLSAKYYSPCLKMKERSKFTELKRGKDEMHTQIWPLQDLLPSHCPSPPKVQLKTVKNFSKGVSEGGHSVM